VPQVRSLHYGPSSCSHCSSTLDPRPKALFGLWVEQGFVFGFRVRDSGFVLRPDTKPETRTPLEQILNPKPLSQPKLSTLNAVCATPHSLALLLVLPHILSQSCSVAAVTAARHLLFPCSSPYAAPHPVASQVLRPDTAPETRNPKPETRNPSLSSSSQPRNVGVKTRPSLSSSSQPRLLPETRNPKP
jgi:hypothetical protein